MNTITKLVVYLVLSLSFTSLSAQTKAADSIRKAEINQKISALEEKKSKIEEEEKESLKTKISIINKRLDAGEITAEQAENLKKEAAKVAALNIENRRDILDKQIALLQRNANEAGLYVKSDTETDGYLFRIGGSKDNRGDSFFYLGEKSKDKLRKYDLRTSTDVVFAIGFNNAIIEGQKLDDSPYKIGGSGFIELGYAWKTRILENSNFFRLKYGFSLQWNKLNIKNNNYLVNNDGTIELEEFPMNLKKAKFRTTNLVFPMHIEFGPSEKIEGDHYFRYSTHKKLKIGLGGYAGINLANVQKLKYKQDGDREKEKQKDEFEASDFIYGLSGYVSLGDVALYVKYDLNPIFKNQAIDQNNISVGLRFDMD
ncbi:hypothetical protein DFQ11_10493 [Winogradskyella epiphytica]|uniref:Outer membrane protein with beta-barrel domain n=1 Tax=Winogradskyella epiphytica TaxID=262005 RepID=A0A2V4WV80_9FLAO|nr:hypothetical protein [Winogradskyella epiphytica]PYE80726.1 hypothetical protein DFQ11_10493 [Winogradskyella epiphytica]GGW67986.1 hypothetical protein GCM10008085_19880 [Winogradskyella epiphytica]